MTYRILSLDGGGIRGLLTCKMLEVLEKECPDFLSKVDLFAGTSTGGILALGLATGKKPSQMAKLYEENGSKIFAKNPNPLRRISHATYSNTALKTALEKEFTSTLKLGKLPKKVLVSSFMLDNSKSKSYKDFQSWKPKFFHNFSSGPINNDNYESVVNVALYTSAAPTFFPIHNGYTDGGVVANNPSMCALAQALEGSGGKLELKDIRLLSVGTGMLPKFISDQQVGDGDWGIKEWGLSLLSIMMDGVSGVADYQCKQLLRQNYHRFNMSFDRDVSLDDVNDIPFMSGLLVDNQNYKYNKENMANLQAAKKWLSEVFLKDTPPVIAPAVKN